MHIVQHLLIRYIKEKLKVSFYLYRFEVWDVPKFTFKYFQNLWDTL